MTTITKGQTLTVTTDKPRRYAVKRVRVVSEVGSGALLVFCVADGETLTLDCDNALNVSGCVINHKPYAGSVVVA